MIPKPAAAPGRTIAHYEILEKLGEGGMGVVYRARDTRLGRLVALKFLAPRLADSPQARGRFLREARSISALNHPHIAVIHDIEQWEGETFLVFEHLPGGSLQTHPPYTLAQALQFSVQLADALGTAHQHGVIHRDIKPANVLFTEDHTLKLADFGLARQAADPQVTGTGTAVGTPAYMAPEQLRGGEADARSDVYSLGLVVHELLTGKLPQAGRTLDVPLPLKPVLERALEAEPHRRYASAAEMAAELRAAADRLASVTAAETVVVDLRRPRRALWALGLVIALAGLIANHAGVGRGIIPGQQLVVLPVANASGSVSWQVFCDGLTATLSRTLARLERSQGSVRVIPADVVRKQRILTATEAQRMLGAHLVVTGTLEPVANGIRLSLAVVDAKTSRRIGADTANFAPEELPALQDWAVSRVARILEVGVRPEAWAALAGYRAHEPGAYELYLQGQGYLSRYDIPEDLANAVASFHKALQRDPKYALAHTGMAEALWRTWQQTRDPQWLEQAEASARHARQLNHRLAPVHTILGRIERSRGHYQEALGSFRHALELEPFDRDAYAGLAATYQSMSNGAEAEAAYRKVLDLRPEEWAGYNDLAIFYLEQRRFAEAEELFQRMIALAPENVTVYQNLGALYLTMGRYSEAGAALERSLSLRPSSAAQSNLGTAYYYQGRYADAAAAMEKAVELRPGDFVLWGNLGDACRWAPDKQARAPQAWSQAAELARQQLTVNPADTQALSSLAVYEAHLGNRAAALAHIAQARRKAGANPRVLFKAARAYELCGRRREALAALRSALEAGESRDNLHQEPEFTGLWHDRACREILPKEVCQ